LARCGGPALLAIPIHLQQQHHPKLAHRSPPTSKQAATPKRTPLHLPPPDAPGQLGHRPAGRDSRAKNGPFSGRARLRFGRASTAHGARRRTWAPLAGAKLQRQRKAWNFWGPGQGGRLFSSGLSLGEDCLFVGTEAGLGAPVTFWFWAWWCRGGGWDHGWLACTGPSLVTHPGLPDMCGSVAAVTAPVRGACHWPQPSRLGGLGTFSSPPFFPPSLLQTRCRGRKWSSCIMTLSSP